MKKLFTIALLSVFAMTGLQAQSSLQFPATLQKSFPVLKDAGYYKMLAKYQNLAASRASRATVCDSSLELDLGLYDFLYKTTVQQLNYTGSWFEANPSIRANELTRFVDTANAFNLTYVTVVFDSLALVGGSLTNPVFDFIPKAKATVYLDSVVLGYGFDADTNTLNTNDSLKFIVQKLVGTTLTTVKTVSYVGAQLKPYVTGQFVSRNQTFGINEQFAQGETFAVRVEFKGADTSRHFFLTYGYADSCGTITFNGQQFASPAYPSTFVGRTLAGEIRASGATATVSNYNNGFGYNIPNTPANCTFVYDQNYDIIPVIHICTDYSASIVPSALNVCPGATVNLDAKVFGVTAAQAPGLQYTWSATGGTLTGTTGDNTSIVMGSTNATVYLTVSESGNLTYDTITLVSNGITATFANPTPSLSCGGTLTLATTTSGVQTGRTYVWNIGATTATLAVSTPGTYTVTVTNSRGCSATASATVTYPGVTNSVDFTLPSNNGKPYLCQGVEYTFTNTSSNKTGWAAQWDFQGGGVSTLTDGVYTFTGLGPNTVKLTMDSANCKFVSTTKSVTIRNCTGVNDVTFGQSISLIPNPTSGNVTIEMANVENNVSIAIYNILGAEVRNFNEETNGSFVKSLNLSDLSNGTYIVKIKNGQRTATKRLVISK